jgi:hypothetical protein
LRKGKTISKNFQELEIFEEQDKKFCYRRYNNYGQGVKVKVKYTLLQALRLCTGCTAHRGSRGIALTIHDHGNRKG